jgi:hypothetical protein
MGYERNGSVDGDGDVNVAVVIVVGVVGLTVKDSLNFDVLRGNDTSSTNGSA